MTTPTSDQERAELFARSVTDAIQNGFDQALGQIDSPRREVMIRNLGAMVLLALEDSKERQQWASARILPSHILYTLTQGLVGETRRNMPIKKGKDELGPTIDALGGPVGAETLALVTSADVDEKTATVALINALWDRKIDKSNLDTAYAQKKNWDRCELLDFVSSMLRGSRLVQNLAPSPTLSPVAKHWGVLIGAHIIRAVHGQTSEKFEYDLASKLLPDAQRFAWLRDIWLKEGMDGLPSMVIVEPALAAVTRLQASALEAQWTVKQLESDRIRMADRTLIEMLDLVGVSLTADQLRKARNRQGPFFESDAS